MSQDLDLLQPVLDERDDVIGFESPWNPWHLVMWTFFGGFFCGGWLLANNFNRLGMRRAGVRCLVIFGLLGVLSTFGGVYYLGVRVGSDADEATARQTLRMALRAVATLAAVVAATMQKGRFRIYESSDQETGPLVAWGFASLIGAIVLQFALAAVVVMILETS